MKRLWFILATAVLGSACANQPAQDIAPSAEKGEADKVSGLSLSLVSRDTQGRQYRLRNAEFTVSGDYYYGYDGGTAAPSTVLSTETEPDADRLSVRLVPGPYRVTLGGDWFIERETANGPEVVEQVVLLNDVTQFAYVYQDWNYELEYRFGVDGTLIDFRHGDLGINIGIELPSDHAADGGPGFPADAGLPWFASTDGGLIID